MAKKKVKSGKHWESAYLELVMSGPYTKPLTNYELYVGLVGPEKDKKKAKKNTKKKACF